MAQSKSEPSKSAIYSIVGNLTGKSRIEEEKQRLEAFIDAFPGSYCGFSKDGEVAYSEKFANMLGLTKIQNKDEILSAVTTSDSAALQTMFNRLEETNHSFSLELSPRVDARKIFRLSGSKGQSLSGDDNYITLWLEDISDEKSKYIDLQFHSEKLEKEVKRFNEALNMMHHAIWMRKNDGDIIVCNTAYGDIFGLSPDEVLKTQKEFSISPKDKALLKSPKELAERALQKGEEQKVACHIIASGKRLYGEIVERPLNGTDMTIGFLKDLTKEKEATTDYERYQSANKILLEQLRSAIAIFDSDRRIEFFNSAFSQLWSLEEQWLNQKPKLGEILEKLREMRRLPEQADFKNYKQGWLDMFSTLLQPSEEMLYLPDNTALKCTFIPHPMGGLMMTFEDVTSNLELESSYNTLIAVQKETLDNLAEGVAVFGEDGRLKLNNPFYKNIWKLNPEDLDGNPHITQIVEKKKSLFGKKAWPEKKDLLISHAIDREVKEGRIQLKDGTLIDYSTVLLPDGGILVTYIDVTDASKVEIALREKNTALQAAEKIKTDFLANVSYQLRTPLSTIMGFNEILDQEFFGKLNDKQKEYTDGIQDAGERLVNLIDDILDLSTIEAGYLDLAMSEFSIYEILENVHKLTNEWARKEKIKLKLICEKDIGSLIADERRIKQVILNLIHNAISFTTEKGLIELKAEKDDTHVKFIVKDNGIGIPKADQDKIFEPFEKLHLENRADLSERSLARGAGLGLSLVKNIVALHGGKIDIESKEGEGTEVTIFIPIEPVLEPLL
ncbi:MAG: ATP-binding protein [Pseudomonadota bacterium]